MSTTRYQHHTSSIVTPYSSDPIVAVKQAAASFPALSFTDMLTAQHDAWRRCRHPETRSKADLERFAGLVAQMEREGASR